MDKNKSNSNDKNRDSVRTTAKDSISFPPIQKRPPMPKVKPPKPSE
jgi:hypothetical protein